MPGVPGGTVGVLSGVGCSEERLERKRLELDVRGSLGCQVKKGGL